MAITVTYNGYNITGESFDIAIRRGRSREVDEFQAATGYVRVRNYDRNFDPPFFTTPSFLLLESGDFLLLESGDKIQLEQGSQASGAYGVIEIGGTLVVQDGAVTVFTGHVEDVNYSYDVSGRYEAEFVVGDGLTSLASSSFGTDWNTTDNQLTGARIKEILQRSDVDLGADVTNIDDGSIRLQGSFTTTVDGESVTTGYVVSAGTNVLQEIQLIARTEFGKFYVDRLGDYYFKARYNFPSSTPVADFDDTATNFPFGDSVQLQFGSEFRAWTATCTRVGGEPQSASASSTPPAALGQRTVTWSGLLFRDDAYSLALAQHLADTYSDPEAVVGSLTVHLNRLSTADRATIAALDINDTVTLTWTPTGSGTQVTQTLVVEGVTYQTNANTVANMTLQLSAFPNTNYFILDTDLLDSGVPLGF